MRLPVSLSINITTRGNTMNILIESRNTHANWGDASMLEVTFLRLNRLFPDAAITLLNHNPDALNQRYGCRANGAIAERNTWLNHRSLWSRVGRRGHLIVDHLHTWQPQLWEGISRMKMRILGYDVTQYNKLLRLFDQANLLVLSGGGFIADPFGSADQAFSLIQLARIRNVPVFMFGQGIGPITDARLRRRAQYILPHVEQIALREKPSSLPVLRQLGIPREKIVITGDDAVALAYREHPKVLGDAIGVNLRVASYSKVEEKILGRVAIALQEVNDLLQAPLLPVPIAFEGRPADTESIQHILARCGVESDGGSSLDCVQSVIRQVAKCRVVLTGSYHAGVFALSQGIPVVALSQSMYYDNKFGGLADQFGRGCKILRTDSDNFETVLPQAIRDAWKQAESLRPVLLKSAQKQIQNADAAYRKMT